MFNTILLCLDNEPYLTTYLIEVYPEVQLLFEL
jgi:hypothetical protein